MEQPRVVAVLGPTNTGKTYLAMERMLGHESGMIGFPLRLLARENYDRAVHIKGAASVALITGEEKIIPPHARYFLCTVESMPVTRQVAFLGVDEIQMCADPDRGHIFTDRLLHARGTAETMFMGAETIRPLLRRLAPEAQYIARPRFSTLTYTGPSKLSRLPARSVVVAFSVADVYALAELVRRQRGGTAIVLGALSPRTRNAQVAMYQAGEVDYLVATDAIGMGLNMHVDHVAFAATRKFDGRGPRSLAPAELAQIAGRAGRFTKDGTFGTTAEIEGFDPETVERIETHRFDALAHLCWRNSDLSFTSLPALRASLTRKPKRPGLVLAREADDELVLAQLSREADILDRARHPAMVELLWDVCQIPDFGKVMSDGHARLLGQIYRFLSARDGESPARLPTDWVARHVDRLDRVDGDIEALMQRIAGIRTWTYVSHRAGWLDNAAAWQDRTRAIEDKLSDAAHDRLIQRFVDRRTASLVGRIKERAELLAVVTNDDRVLAEGHDVGTLEGFRFVADTGSDVSTRTDAERAINAAALRALRGEIRRRLKRLEDDNEDSLSHSADGRVIWRGAVVARWVAGDDPLHPRVEPIASDLLEPGQRERLRKCVATWTEATLRAALPALFVSPDPALSGAGRGLLFQLTEAMGTLPRANALNQIEALSGADRRILRQAGLRLGRESVYFPALLTPRLLALKGLLWAVHHRCEVLPPPPAGRTSLSLPKDALALDHLEAIGFRALGPRVVRIDIIERLAGVSEASSRRGTPVAPTLLTSLLGCKAAELPAIFAALGYPIEESPDGLVVRPRPRRWRSQPMSRERNQRRKTSGDGHSPFAELKSLVSAS